MQTRLLLCAMIVAAPVAALGAQKKCGAESCGAPVKTKKTINGVAHNCDSTTCSKSCCTLGDPPVCTIEKSTSHSCVPARIRPGMTIEKFRAPPAATRRQ